MLRGKEVVEMTKHRTAARVDDNQTQIVKELRQIPGITVQPGHDDILVGHKGKTYWFEVKNENQVSSKTGDIRPSAIKDSQIKLLGTWQGHYKIVWNLNQILLDLGLL